MSKYEDLEELKQLIIHTLDETEFLDILGISFAELVERFEEEIEENYPQLVAACR